VHGEVAGVHVVVTLTADAILLMSKTMMATGSHATIGAAMAAEEVPQGGAMGPEAMIGVRVAWEDTAGIHQAQAGAMREEEAATTTTPLVQAALRSLVSLSSCLRIHSEQGRDTVTCAIVAAAFCNTGCDCP
jgi:hypothetical protein